MEAVLLLLPFLFVDTGAYPFFLLVCGMDLKPALSLTAVSSLCQGRSIPVGNWTKPFSNSGQWTVVGTVFWADFREGASCL